MAENPTVKRQKPLSRTQREKFDGTTRFSKLPPKENRARQIKRSDDTFKNIHVGLQEMDEAVVYFFNNVIKPRVLENGILIDVPLMYGDPEHWAQIQTRGYMRDAKNKIIAPVVMYRRTSMSRDDSVPIDKADRNLVHVYPRKWSDEHNKYDRFSLVHNIRPTYEMYNIVIPDHVIISYECVIWTSFITQMNKIVEQMNYWEGSYWGDDDKFKFKAKIDSFDQSVDVDTDKGRLVRSNFSLELKGYLIPEVANDLLTTQKEFTKQQIILDTETEVDVLAMSQVDPLAQKIMITTKTQPATGTNQTINDLINQKFAQLIGGQQFLRKLSVYSTLTTPGATIVTGSGDSVVSYPNVYTASVPSNMQPYLFDTREDDFLVFVNGQYMEHDAFVIQQSGSSFVVTASDGSLGYSLESTDEIVVWGKFE